VAGETDRTLFALDWAVALPTVKPTVQTKRTLHDMQSAQPLLAEILADFATLREAYQRTGLLGKTVSHSLAWKLLGGGAELERFQRTFLLLDALVRHRVVRATLQGEALRHVAVFGGNNVGKSTVINILAKAQVAGVSPEGGHTRCAHAFVPVGAKLFVDNSFAFNSFSVTASEPPQEDRFDQYEVSRLKSETLPSNIVLWDTPDCDAVGSVRYVDAVVETVAASDVLVYVTTVEKYAVEHLVEWLFQLHDAGISIVECLNKTPKRDRELVIRKQASDVFPTMSERLGLASPSPVIVALRNLTEGEESDLWGPDHPEANRLRDEVVAAAEGADRAVAGRAASDFVLRRIDEALAPVRMEAGARQRWRAMVETAVSDFVASYVRDYLTSATVIEPFSRLNLQILKLLDPDIRFLNDALALLRWPSKIILKAGRRVISLALSGGASTADAKLPLELKAYSDAHTELLNTLGMRIDVERGAVRHHPFWDILAEDWPTQLNRLSDEFGAEIVRHMRATDTAIQAAAGDIYDKLKERPNTLSVLRGVRVATNVGGALVGFILPHHGMVYELIEEAIVAPAMVTATEAATGAAVKDYVTRRRDKIVDTLTEDANVIARTLYREPLLAIGATAMTRAGSLSVGQDILDRLPSGLRQLRVKLAASQT
jgi:hypothetical protein